MTQPINDGFVQLIATGGETSLAWDFKIGQYTDIKIIRTRSGVKATLVLNTDYTIAANQLNQPGGGIANLIGTATPALAGDIYTLLLDTPSQRLADFSQQGAFQAATVNAELDNLTRMAQRLTRDTNKSLKYDENLNIPNAIIIEAIDEDFAIVGGATSGTFKEGPSAAQISNAAANAISAAASAAIAEAASVAAQAANGGIGRVVRLATSGNVTLSGLQTIDGVVGAAGDRILVRRNTLSFQNGLYNMSSGAWTRVTDANTWSSFVGMIVTPSEGAAYKNHVYISLVTQGGTLGATAITFDTIPIDGHVGTEKIAFNPLLNNFRLTPTSGVPVVTGDANAVTTLYMTPYNGNQIALYNGSRWDVRHTAEISISLASTTAGLGYDVFCYDNSGTPTLELTAWTNSTTRATALVYQNGVLVKSGATTRRYLGSFYCHTNGQTASSLTNTGATTGRYIWNNYNRVLLRMQRFESTVSWAYTGGYRQANGSTVNQLNFFVGVVEDAVACSQNGLANIASANSGALTAIGLNSTTSPLNGSVAFLNSMIINYGTYGSSTVNATPTLGLNYLSWIEYGNASGCTFFGSTYGQGINGAIFC